MGNNNNRRPRSQFRRRKSFKKSVPQSDNEADASAAPAEAAVPQSAQSTTSAGYDNSIENLNLSVLRRYKPSINSILSVAPYATVYGLNKEQREWDKSGIEGTMFVCELSQGKLGQERYAIFILNRLGLQNFVFHLSNPKCVEVTPEFLILGPLDGEYYSIWIYSELTNSTADTRERNVNLIKQCAKDSEKSRRAVEQGYQESRASQIPQTPVSSQGITSGPPLLQQLFALQKRRENQ